MKGKHIDDAQTSTVDEHFKLLVENKSVLDPELTDIFPNDFPDWYNEKLFKKGQNYYKQNMLLGELTYILGLISILSIPTIRQVVKLTKQSSTPCLAFKRHLGSQLHVFNIIMCDPNDPHSNLYKSINITRWRHNIITKISNKTGLEGILQKDMAITQCGFIAYFFIITESFGLRNKLEEEEGFNHFWRVFGHLIGISDRLNICRKNAIETRELSQKIVNEIFTNYLNNASSDFIHVISNVLDGIGYIDISLNRDALLALSYQLHNIEYKTSLGWYSWLNMKYRDLILKLYFLPYIGPVIRIYYNILMKFIYWSATAFPIFAWLSFGKSNTQINLYPKYK
ncbi:uncharacterized protein LOC114937629 [Nylanderia fulva]|uniref:uncharacterized protein LOC114937629 n=1 Tax=Nylanderia fulva TaxID=613905 RepID=UPI0010FAF175|nr:uncharacterized protein LOC114937629 [Nylanderia fulva]